MNMPHKRITIESAGKHAGETVEIAGWLYNLRKSGKIVFPQLRDGTGIMQCVAVKSNLPEELFETLKDLTQESSFIVCGKIRAEPRAQFGFSFRVKLERNACSTCSARADSSFSCPYGDSIKRLYK